MNLSDFQVFIFDLDGTLIDSGKYHAQAFADAVLEASGYTLTADERLEFFASHSNRFCPVLNERHGLVLDSDSVLVAKRARMKEIFKAELFEGAREFLEKWHGQRRLALATNSPMSFAKPALEEAGIVGLFECITTADDVRHRKPDPQIFEIAFQRMGADPLKTLVFEDQLIGIQAAQHTGASVVAVNNGQSVDFPPDVPVMTWKELLNL